MAGRKRLHPDTKLLHTEKQAATALEITTRVKAGEPLTRELINDAHLKHYKCKGTAKTTPRIMAASIASSNMKKPHFLATLGLTDPEAQFSLKNVLWNWLHGTDPLHPKDKELRKVAAQLLSKGAIAQREHVVHSDSADFDGRTIDELKFFETHDRFPTEKETEHFGEFGCWPGETAAVQ